MTEPDILEHILMFLDEYVGIPDPGPDTRLTDNGLDSIQVTDLAAFLEYRFGVKVPPSQVTLDAFATPRRIATLVTRLSPQ